MSSKSLLASVIEEVVALSTLPPVIASIVRNRLITYYDNHTLLVSEDYPDVLKTLYSYDDNKKYCIISLTSSEGYPFILLPYMEAHYPKVFSEIIVEVKNKFELSNSEIGAVVEKIQQVRKSLKEIIDSSTRTSRMATGFTESNFAFPPVEVMQKFYECGRKAVYYSYEETQRLLMADNDVYKCKHCSFYHQGQTPTGDEIPQEIKEGRWRTGWRRYHNI
jgi:rubrerythrin